SAGCEGPGDNEKSVPGDAAAKCQITVYVNNLWRRLSSRVSKVGSWAGDDRLSNHAFDRRCQVLQGSDRLQVWRQGGRDVLDIGGRSAAARIVVCAAIGNGSGHGGNIRVTGDAEARNCRASRGSPAAGSIDSVDIEGVAMRRGICVARTVQCQCGRRREI